MEFGYLNSIRKSTIVILLSFPRLCGNSVTDVSVGFPAAWRLHTSIFKCGKKKICSYILPKKNCNDLNLGGSLCIFTFLSFPRLWALSIFIYLLKGFDFDLFLFLSILSGVTLKTSNAVIR